MSALGFFTPLDWLVVGITAALCLAVGLWVGRRVHTGTEFLTAGRRFPAGVLAVSLAVTAGSGLLLAGGVAQVAQHGVVALRPLLIGFVWLPLLILLWVPVLQRGGLITVPQYLGRRFSPGVRRLAAGVSLLLLLALLAAELAAFGATFRALTGGPALLWAAAVTALVVIYTAWGGQRGAMVTNLVQGLLLAVGGVALVLWASDTVQLGVLWQSTPLSQSSLVPEPMRGGSLSVALGLFVDAAVISGVGLLASQAVVGRLVAGRGERAAGLGALLGLGPLLLLVMGGVVVAGLLHGWLVDMGRLPGAEPAASMSLASVLASLTASPGGLGLLSAALLAAVLSTADALLLGIAAVVAVDLDRPGESDPGRDVDRRRLRVARVSVAGAALVALALSMLFDWLGGLPGLAGVAGAMLGGPLALVLAAGLVSRRLGPRGALLALAAGLVAGLVSLAWVAGPSLAPPDVLRAGLAAGGATLVGLLLGWVLAGRQVPPVRRNLTWRHLAPAWSAQRARLRLAKGSKGAQKKASARDAADDADRLPQVKLPAETVKELGLSAGHEVHVTAARRSWFGLRSFRARLAKPTASGDGLEASAEALAAAGLRDGEVVIVIRVA